MLPSSCNMPKSDKMRKARSPTHSIAAYLLCSCCSTSGALGCWRAARRAAWISRWTNTSAYAAAWAPKRSAKMPRCRASLVRDISRVAAWASMSIRVAKMAR
eukprot:scaffold451_cov184-Amphora_coffeaeformis.AAC.13